MTNIFSKLCGYHKTISHGSWASWLNIIWLLAWEKKTKMKKKENIYTKETRIERILETRIEGDTCTPMFISALFTVARTWKQPRCPSADEWIRKLWYYTQWNIAAVSLQSCPTLCDPIDSSPPGSAVSGILQARTLEWVAISFSNAWKWKVKVKSLSHVWLSATSWTAAHQAPLSMGFSRQEYWSGVPLPTPQGNITQPLKRMHLNQF